MRAVAWMSSFGWWGWEREQGSRAGGGGWASTHARSYLCVSQPPVARDFDIAVTAVLRGPASQLANVCQCGCIDYGSNRRLVVGYVPGFP